MSEWHFVCVGRASKYFTDHEAALEDICRGCTMEKGWIDMIHPRGEICPWMNEISDYYGEPTVEVYEDDDGHRMLRCAHRKDRKKPKPRGHKKAKGQMALFD